MCASINYVVQSTKVPQTTIRSKMQQMKVHLQGFPQCGEAIEWILLISISILTVLFVVKGTRKQRDWLQLQLVLINPREKKSWKQWPNDMMTWFIPECSYTRTSLPLMQNITRVAMDIISVIATSKQHIPRRSVSTRIIHTIVMRKHSTLLRMDWINQFYPGNDCDKSLLPDITVCQSLIPQSDWAYH